MIDHNYEIGKYLPVNQTEFLLSRATAIQSYANLEFALSTLFSNLAGISIEIGGLIFFRITNTHSRTRILNDLKDKRFRNTHGAFWVSLISFIRTLDQRRNEIIHWHVVNNINLQLDYEKAASLSLTPPTGWTLRSGASITEIELGDFINRCGFATKLVNMFNFIMHQMGERSPDVLATWQQIFSEPITYPPPDAHPLSPNYKAPQTQAPLSEA